MALEKTKQLDVIPSFSWQTRAAMFAGIFGGIWLFVDPLITFLSGMNIWGEFGLWGYVLLLLVSALSTFGIEYFRKSNIRSHKIYITLTVVLTESGERHRVQVPQDMRVEKFIQLFLEYAQKSAAPKSILLHHDLFNWQLQVKRRHGTNSLVEKKIANREMKSRINSWDYFDIPNEITLKDSGVINNDVCKLYGVIKIENTIAIGDIRISNPHNDINISQR